MRAYILTIGDELLYGQRADKNGPYLAAQLSQLGFEVVGLASLGDAQAAIVEGLAQALRQAPCVLLTGGLGPTEDDGTRAALAHFLGRSLVPHPSAAAQIRAYAARRGRDKPYEAALSLLPEGAEALSNPVGLAPGLWYAEQGRLIVALPGVPQEMRAMYEQVLAPQLQAQCTLPVLRHLYCQTAGLPESALVERLRDFEKDLPDACKLAYLPRPGEVSLRLSLRAATETEALGTLKEPHQRLQALVQDVLYATDERSLVQVLARTLSARGLWLAVAESCTGGQVAQAFTTEAGASAYFLGGIVAYRNRLKEQLLGVSQADLQNHGAVSRPVVEAMARGAQTRLGADIALASSGIAGPEGGTPDKPVGTVWLACAYKEQIHSQCHHFASDRAGNTRYATAYLLAMLWQQLKPAPQVFT